MKKFSNFWRHLGGISVLLTLLLLSFSAPTWLLRRHNAPPGHTDWQSMDRQLQSRSENLLRDTLEQTKAMRGCVLIIDMHSGAIKTMVSLSRRGHSQNICVGSAWEPGSVMKPLLVAAALDSSAIDLTKTTFFDANRLEIDGYIISNAIAHEPGVISVQDTITQSINVGAVSILKEMGQASDTIDTPARKTYYQYLSQRYQFGAGSNLNIPGEATGYIPRPDVGKDIAVTYAQMAIGQSMTVTPLQLTLAYTAILNGGTYYMPRLDSGGKTALNSNVVSDETSSQMRTLLETAFRRNTPRSQRSGFTLGGKTGTAHAVSESGDYFPQDKDNGAYIGFISHDGREHVMLVRLDSPDTSGFASAQARELWMKLMTTTIDTTGDFVSE